MDCKSLHEVNRIRDKYDALRVRRISFTKVTQGHIDV